MDLPTLTGEYVRLEPLELRHAAELTEAANEDREPYRWSFVPRTHDEMHAYIRRALGLREEHRALAFAIVRLRDGSPIGSTRFFDLERWNWPSEHPRSDTGAPDAGEIGYTWLARSAMRTGANTETKLLLLTYAFEHWKLLRVCFHTDARNERSASALARIGARFEGVLHAHRLGTDLQPRDSKRYAITAPEWPKVKERLVALLTGGGGTRDRAVVDP